jgi:hypothetical protein
MGFSSPLNNHNHCVRAIFSEAEHLTVQFEPLTIQTFRKTTHELIPPKPKALLSA